MNSYIRYNTANYGSGIDESSRKVQVDRIIVIITLTMNLLLFMMTQRAFNTITKSAVGRRILSPSTGILLSAGALNPVH